MGKFNLKKQASVKDVTISEKRLAENRKNMNLSNEQQDVVSKNINLSLPVKDKDNTIPFNQQLEASRKNKTVVAIIENDMSKEIIDFKSKNKKQVMDINVETQKYVDKKADEYKKAEDTSKENTAFWDKYVGMQLEEEMTKVDNNIPSSASQLQNNPDRFQNEKINKMVMASLGDADAMLFHIYATAAKENRNLTDIEEQQIADINSGKIRLLAVNKVSPIRRSLESKSDPVIKEELGVAGVYESDGTKIDEFKSCAEAKSNYPEGELV
jgi:hypothetical protein